MIEISPKDMHQPWTNVEILQRQAKTNIEKETISVAFDDKAEFAFPYSLFRRYAALFIIYFVPSSLS
jgi:hypothetical protein